MKRIVIALLITIVISSCNDNSSCSGCSQGVKVDRSVVQPTMEVLITQIP
jgi:hypothetical protein